MKTVGLSHVCSQEQIVSRYESHLTHTNYIDEQIFPGDLKEVYDFFMAEKVYGFGIKTIVLEQKKDYQSFKIRFNKLFRFMSGFKDDEIYHKCGHLDEGVEEATIAIHRTDSEDSKRKLPYCILLRSQQNLTLVTRRYQITKKQTFDALKRGIKKLNKEELGRFKKRMLSS